MITNTHVNEGFDFVSRRVDSITWEVKVYFATELIETYVFDHSNAPEGYVGPPSDASLSIHFAKIHFAKRVKALFDPGLGLGV